MVKMQNLVIWIQTTSLFTYPIYKDIAEDVETRFDNSNLELDRPLPKGKDKKVTGLMKDELRVKTYSYQKENNHEDKKANDTKKCAIKKRKLEDYKNCL